ncbi:MAG: hypothetical protein ABIJ00_01745, partial [Candidatus Eisenbacteria bacterium]
SNAHRGKERKRARTGPVPSITQPPPARTASSGWRELIKRVYQIASSTLTEIAKAFPSPNHREKSLRRRL